MPRAQGRSRAPLLSVYALSARMSAAKFTCHKPGVAGYSLERGLDDGVIEVWHLGPIEEVLPAGPAMAAWGRHLAAAGFTVHVAEDTHLLVTLPTTGGQAAASHAVERAA